MAPSALERRAPPHPPGRCSRSFSPRCCCASRALPWRVSQGPARSVWPFRLLPDALAGCGPLVAIACADPLVRAGKGSAAGYTRCRIRNAPGGRALVDAASPGSGRCGGDLCVRGPPAAPGAGRTPVRGGQRGRRRADFPRTAARSTGGGLGTARRCRSWCKRPSSASAMPTGCRGERGGPRWQECGP